MINKQRDGGYLAGAGSTIAAEVVVASGPSRSTTTRVSRGWASRHWVFFLVVLRRCRHWRGHIK